MVRTCNPIRDRYEKIMAEKLRVFVSASGDLENERGVIGRALADLPVQIGVEIRRTPLRGASYDDIFEMIANCDRVYFLLGQGRTLRRQRVLSGISRGSWSDLSSPCVRRCDARLQRRNSCVVRS